MGRHENFFRKTREVLWYFPLISPPQDLHGFVILAQVSTCITTLARTSDGDHGDGWCWMTNQELHMKHPTICLEVLSSPTSYNFTTSSKLIASQPSNNRKLHQETLCFHLSSRIEVLHSQMGKNHTFTTWASDCPTTNTQNREKIKWANG